MGFVVKFTNAFFILLFLSQIMEVCHMPMTCDSLSCFFTIYVHSLSLLVPMKKVPTTFLFSHSLVRIHGEGSHKKMPPLQQWQAVHCRCFNFFFAGHSGSCGCTKCWLICLLPGMMRRPFNQLHLPWCSTDHDKI